MEETPTESTVDFESMTTELSLKKQAASGVHLYEMTIGSYNAEKIRQKG